MRATRIWLWLAVTALIILFTTGKCSAESLRDYYPLHAGDQWQYSIYRKEIGLRDTSYMERKITAIVTFEGKEYFEIKEGDIIFYQRYNASGDTLWEYDKASQREFIKYHVVVNTLEKDVCLPWRFLPDSFEGWISCTSSIDTPAGNFEDAICHIYYRYYETLFGTGRRETLCFARDIRLVRVNNWRVNEIHEISQIVWSLTYAKVNGIEYGIKRTAMANSAWGQIKSVFR
ncbi:MAG: hypothetical protein DRQ02_02345 [Candidatus Latescibacterota bacterium]|nr:MAG: hypothetical protein DRQ02_02345 [Candidatus Latescibacterota bacterium]